MPDAGQVRTACLRVMQLGGLASVTTPNVADMMTKVGVSPGSRRDLHPMVQDWKYEQRKIAAVPEHIPRAALAFATMVWEMAWATATEARLQEPVTAPRKRKSKRETEQASMPEPQQRLLPLSPKLSALQESIEHLLRPDAPPAELITEPMRAVDLWRRLPAQLRELTTFKNLGRDFEYVAKRSKFFVVVKGPGNARYFRTETAPSSGEASTGKPKTYVRRNTPASQVRAENELQLTKVLTLLAKQKAGLTKERIADLLWIEPKKRPPFFQMLSNATRGDKPRWRLQGDKYVAVRRRPYRRPGTPPK
jgi:hypothetical protein